MAEMVHSIDLYYENARLNNDKTYHLALIKDNDRYSVLFAYGRRGNNLNRGTKVSGVPYHSAIATYDEIVREKRGKGYRETPGISGTVFDYPKPAPPKPVKAQPPIPQPAAKPTPKPAENDLDRRIGIRRAL